jgi:8-oxo-dGTP pyrophosphatase MutT (NUDIX family)
MIDKIGLLTIRDGKVLLCRKSRGKPLLILPGGKREEGESSMECLTRELREELGEVEAPSPELVAVYVYENKKNVLRVELYQAELLGDPHAQAEISELVWFGSNDDWGQLAPSLIELIFPDLMARGILTGWLKT